MAYYAYLDKNNIVTQVITGIDETELIEGLTPEIWYANFRGQKCVRTSYNNNIRKRYAIVGGKYDEENDVFLYPQPYNSWVLNENFAWVSPIGYPVDGKDYDWDEETLQWKLIE